MIAVLCKIEVDKVDQVGIAEKSACFEDEPSLPKVSDEMLEEALRRTEGHVMSSEERQTQLVSFVWGNALEGDRGTRESVCRHLNIVGS